MLDLNPVRGISNVRFDLSEARTAAKLHATLLSGLQIVQLLVSDLFWILLVLASAKFY